MVSPLAREDYDDLIAAGLAPTLEDFDRLNQLALRLTDGAETTAQNFPRIGWAGDTPFYQPTCAAFAWYLECVDRADFDAATKDACWFFALAHGRTEGVFTSLERPGSINMAVNRWLATLPVTREEIARACRYAATGFDDASAAKPDAEKSAAKTDAERREESRANLAENVTVAAALTGIPPDKLMRETPSTLAKMVEAVRANNPMGGAAKDNGRAKVDYDLTLREIRKRLQAAKAAKEADDGK